MNIAYPLSLTLREALDSFFKQYNLGEEGGLNSNWAYLDMKWFRIPFPNTSSRKKALIYHDIHHIVTGYSSDWKGEAEISAWEISTGCGSYSAAWILDLFGLAMGLCFYPVRTFRAFIRGRRTKNLYRNSLSKEQLLPMSISQVQSLLLLNKPMVLKPTYGEVLAFTGWSAFALLYGFVFTLLPWLLLAGWLLM